MTRFFLILILFSFLGTKKSLNKAYKVTYNKRLVVIDSSKIIDSNIKERIKNLNSSLQKVEYSLYFNDVESFFSLNETMENDISKLSPRAVTSGGMEGKYYYNKPKELRLNQLELFGELFLVEHPINMYNWVLTKESKNISGKLTYKAVAEVKVDDFRGNFEFPIEVWYCPEIPVNFGPSSFFGLPGLVLEVIYDNKISTYANKIEILKDEKIIPKLTKGIKVNQKEFTEIFNQEMKKILNED